MTQYKYVSLAHLIDGDEKPLHDINVFWGKHQTEGCWVKPMIHGSKRVYRVYSLPRIMNDAELTKYLASDDAKHIWKHVEELRNKINKNGE